MSNFKISDYVDVDSLDGTELFLVSKNGAYRKMTLDEIRNLAADIANTELAELVGKAANAHDVKNILNTINTNLENQADSITQINSSLSESTQNIAYLTQQQAQQIRNRGIQDSILSINNSKVAYEDTASTIFTENWANLSNWVLPTTPGMQVSNNKLYSTGTGGGASGANHSYALSATDKLRAVFNVNIPDGNANGGLIIGVSKDTAGATPTVANAFGLYIYGTTTQAKQFNSNTQTNTAENVTPTSGDYIITVTVDYAYISIVAKKTDDSIEMSCRRYRSGFAVNNLFIFNSDTRGTSGISVGLCSARKEMQTIFPRTYGEGLGKTVQWTGDGTQSFRIYLPKNYDSRKPCPLAICWHGDGSHETSWGQGSTDSNYPLIQKALTDAGYIVLGCSLNSNKETWGNTASTNAYYEAYKYVRDTYAIGAVVFFANSMGGIESLNALSENKIPCVAWAGTSSTFNLANNYANSTFTSIIKTAYGIASDGSDYSIKTAGRDPALMSEYAFRCLPMWMASAEDDTVVSKTNNMDKLALKVADTALELIKIDVASGGHGFDISQYTSQIVSFFNKYIKS